MSALEQQSAYHDASSSSPPVAEHKTRFVHRTASGDRLPDAVDTVRRGAGR